VAARKTPESISNLVVKGLVVGYLYTIALSASSIAVCESKRPGECSEAWNQGYATASSLVATFLAYLIPPSERVSSGLLKREENDAS
jgi:TRAP-type C4-dicarboxylate transport system permease large subunit